MISVARRALEGRWGCEGDGRRGGGTIETGTKVRLRPELFTYSRPHLLYHARSGDIGVVAPPSKQSPAMARLYVIVHFDQCGHDHRLLPAEVVAVDGRQG
jgi:hypothetical protein